MSVMNKEIKEEWVNALRSGKYKQGVSALKNKTSYCCLGVLCDISQKYGVGRWEGVEFVCETDSSESVLPNDVVNWAELNSRVGKLNNSTCLSMLNDGGKTFNEIADIIEEQL